MKKILVTGASGFLGKFVTEKLIREGFEVHAVSSNESYRREGAVCHHVNLLDESRLEGLFAEVRPEGWMHLAWETRHSVYADSPDNLIWLRNSLKMLEYFARYGGQRLVSAGTCNEYDLSRGILAEDSPYVEQTQLYGVTKRSFYNVASAMFHNTEIRYACGRIFFLYGENDKPTRAVPYAIENFLSGKEVSCNAADAVRDYMHVEDGADAFVALLKSDLQGAVNIASGIPVTMGEIFRKIAALTGKEELLTLNPMKGGAPLILAETGRMKEQLGFTPKISLDEGLARTVEHHKKLRADSK